MTEQMTHSQIKRRLARGWLVYAFVFSVYAIGPTVALAGLYHSPTTPTPGWALSILVVMLSFNMIVESIHLYSNFWGRHSHNVERTIGGDILLFSWSAIMMLGPIFMMPSWPVLVRCMAACWLSAIGVQMLPERPRLEDYDGGLVLIEPKLWSHDSAYSDPDE
jgi:hypothetical protein